MLNFQGVVYRFLMVFPLCLNFLCSFEAWSEVGGGGLSSRNPKNFLQMEMTSLKGEYFLEKLENNRLTWLMVQKRSLLINIILGWWSILYISLIFIASLYSLIFLHTSSFTTSDSQDPIRSPMAAGIRRRSCHCEDDDFYPGLSQPLFQLLHFTIKVRHFWGNNSQFTNHVLLKTIPNKMWTSTFRAN